MSEKLHFDINAAVVRQLGEELVSDEVTAIIELVKNSYDADATFANVVVDTNHILTKEESAFPGTQGYISIEDDGFGMNHTDIVNGWLTISLSGKREMKKKGEKTKNGRTPLGDKGLGRLSTQRLGNQLDMITRKSDGKSTYHVSFSWADFREDVALSVVPVNLKELPLEARSKGTKLVISKLRSQEQWQGDNRDELVRRLSQLIFPFGEARPFRVLISINGQRINLETIAESVREAAVARFKIDYTNGELALQGKIKLSRLRIIGDDDTYQRMLANDGGREFFAYLTSPDNRYTIPDIELLNKDGWFIKYSAIRSLESLGGVASVKNIGNKNEDGTEEADTNENSDDERLVANPGNFKAEFDEFNLRGVNLDSVDSVFDKSAEFSQFIKNQAGVRIFRNGFGVRPYGVDGNDWLNLGGGQTSGLSYYGLRPNNIIGYVAISEDENQQLREKTDREGLITSPFVSNFFLLLNESIKIINENYNRLRRSYNKFKELQGSEKGNFISGNSPIATMRETSQIANVLIEKSTQLEKRIDNVTHSVKLATEKVEKQPLFASDTEKEFNPLLREIYSTLEEARSLISELQRLLPQAQRLEQVADYLEPKIETLEQQLLEFSELAGLGLIAEALSHEIHTVADRLATRTKMIISASSKGEITRSELVTYTEHVLSAVSTLRKQLSHLAPSLRYVREQREIISVQKFFHDMQDFYADRFYNSKISFTLREPFKDFSVKINRGRLTQIVDNLILNSEYWLTEAIRKGQIEKPTIIIESDCPYIRISDNAGGIDPTIERILFQPFVSTKPRNQGRGLGLFIVQQLLDSINGHIALLPDRNSSGRRHIFQIDLSGVINAR